MIDVQKYISGGTVKREMIAMDIKYRKICSKEDLSEIINNPNVKAAFYGQGFHDKVPKDQWTEKYLDKLSYAVVAECFNAEYLDYLYEVAEYVDKRKKLIKGFVSSLAALIAAVAALALILSNWNK